MSQEINFLIDGKKISIPAGKTILYGATANNIQIPTLCYSGNSSKNTSCFVCVVKDRKSGKFMPSCASVPYEGQEIDSDTAEVHEMRKTSLNLLLSEHTGDCEAPCTISCPAHAKVEEYVREGRKGNYLESLKIIKNRIPLPMSIGRVCPRFCEKDCRRNVIDDPVGINEFKRIAADLCYDNYMEDMAPLNGKKIAIVGAGPAGLSTAYYLRLMGFSSTIFDKAPNSGGMLRYGIPEYRLPKEILNKELFHFEKMGEISFKFNTEIGKDIQLETLEKEFDAVAVCIGSWKSTTLQTDGEELATDGIVYLYNIADSQYKWQNPGKTIVVGGGNTAMDCLRTSVRLGSNDVTCFYRRTEAEMPAEKIEIKEAKEEGVKFEFLIAPTKLEKIGNKLALTCLRMELGEEDASGRRKPVPIANSEFITEADTVITAIGQKTKAFNGLKTNKWGDIDVDKKTFSMSGKIFAAGDCVTGAATVVEAVAGGRTIAYSIKDYLMGTKNSEPLPINVSRGHWNKNKLSKEDLVFLKTLSEENRLKLPHISIQERVSTFNEVCSTASKEQIKMEGERCIECSCTAKGDCKLKSHSETYGAKVDTIKGSKVIVNYDTRHPLIINDRNKCIKCGICVKTCQEVVNKSLLGFKNRGFYTEVGTAYGKEFPTYCSTCMKCIEECPVGALDLKHKE